MRMECNTHRIIIGDSRIMNEVNDESVHLVVTSPPYWQLKDYGSPNQIGFDDTYEDYINNLNLVWKECFRVLHKGCRLCINIGDQFARSVYYGRYKIIPIRTEIIKFCETIGFDYMGAIIWQKVTTTNTTGGATIMGSFPYPRNGIVKLDYEFILIFKKLGNPPKTSKSVKDESKLTKEEWNTYFQGHWNIPGEKQDKHLAMFPEELPRRLIKMFTFIRDTVLDPFLGSGTTTLAARKLSRYSVGYEINPKFLPLIKKKVGYDSGLLHDVKFQIQQQKQKIEFKKLILKQPYVFRDPVKVERKVDPKKLLFGSKIDSNTSKRQEFFSVKSIISPNLIELSNGLKLRLLGIKAKQGLENKASEFLRNVTENQKVFFKFDKDKYDDQNNLCGYLYLKNKTFVNLHLLKNGLVNVDESISFSKKEHFGKYKKETDGKRMGFEFSS